jgi:hypothetical protein
MTEDEMRELLRQAAAALTEVGKKALVVKPTLDKPYPDEPSWTPWTRYLGEPARNAYNLGVEIRRRLRTEPVPEVVVEDWRCEKCEDPRWLGWRAGPAHEGFQRKAQCVPCGHVQDLPKVGQGDG